MGASIHPLVLNGVLAQRFHSSIVLYSSHMKPTMHPQPRRLQGDLSLLRAPIGF